MGLGLQPVANSRRRSVVAFLKVVGFHLDRLELALFSTAQCRASLKRDAGQFVGQQLAAHVFHGEAPWPH